MKLPERARDVADEAKETAAAVSRRGKETGEAVARSTGSKTRDGLRNAAGSAREQAESVRERATEGGDASNLPARPAAVREAADRSAAELTVEIRRFLERVDHRYAAKSAVSGAQYGYAAGPYGAAVGAGAGSVYGAYSSTRAAFDPENPTGPFEEAFDADRYLDGVRHAKTGYEVGKSFGKKGKVAGAAVGAGMAALPEVAERVTERLSDRAEDGTLAAGDSHLDALSAWLFHADLPGRLPAGDRLERSLRLTGELVAENRETFARAGAVATAVDWATAQRAAVESFAAFQRVSNEGSKVETALEGSRAVRESLSLWADVYSDVRDADPELEGDQASELGGDFELDADVE